MEIIESIGWIALGFVPMIAFLELAWRKGVTNRLKVRELRGNEEQEKKVHIVYVL